MAPHSGYRVTTDGVSVIPDVRSLAGEDSLLREGDIITAGGISMVLGPPGDYEYTVIDDNNRVVTMAKSGDSGEIVAIGSFSGGARPPEATSARGISTLNINADADANADADLSAVDGANTFIEYTLDLHPRGAALNKSPRFPVNARYLRLRFFLGPEFSTQEESAITNVLHTLAELPDLRHLEIEIRSVSDRTFPFDASHLTGLSALERLEVRGPLLRLPVLHPESLRSLQSLRALDLSFVEIGSIDFVSGIHSLRWLNIHNTDVTSLAPIADHPNLQVILAESSPIADIPEPPPRKLRKVSAMTTSIDGAALAQLHDRSGATVISNKFSGLERILTCANRIHIRRGRPPTPDDTHRLDVVDETKISNLIKLLRVRGETHSDERRCPFGSPTLEFYRDDLLISSVSFDIGTVNHGSPHPPSLSWSGWSGQLHGEETSAELTESDARSLCAWFDNNGIPTACGTMQAAHNALAERGEP